ncbi:MAG: hypothetical protein JW395_1933 [Nitrospira sp.]|nr:hypothetical protein [Nitrospira sp.]
MVLASGLEISLSARKQLFDRLRESTTELWFEFVQTGRLNIPAQNVHRLTGRSIQAAGRAEPDSLSERMIRFISSAQLDYRAFFASSEPDLFRRIMERLSSATSQEPPPVSALLKRLRAIATQDRRTERLGLENDHWDYQELAKRLNSLSSADSRQALAVAEQYVGFLESRASVRQLVAERLFTFERIMSEFFSGKSVTVSPREGLHIESDDGTELKESDLSSGERHLLYLMVSAALTRRRGTVLAIDEPEMSMHIAWQRKLVPGLLECAARAEPQFIFATHSPQLAAKYSSALIELK